jgi:hypothetical protein
MQDAAQERRMRHEQRRLEKLQRDELKKLDNEHKLTELKLQKQAEKQAAAEERLKRQQAFQVLKKKEEEMRRERSEKMVEKLELGSQRKNEQLQQVVEKVKAANENAKTVAERVHASRMTPENPRAAFLIPELATIDESMTEDMKAMKKRVKKIKAKIRAESASYKYSSAIYGSANERFKKTVSSAFERLEILSNPQTEVPTSLLDQELEKMKRSMVLAKGYERQSQQVHLYSSGILDSMVMAVNLQGTNRPIRYLLTYIQNHEYTTGHYYICLRIRR